MKWAVQQLITLKQKGIKIDESVDMNHLKQFDREIRHITPVHVKGDAFIAKDTATFQLEISGSLTLPCARTLNDVEHPFAFNATEVFQLNEWATLDEDEEIHKLEDNTVDLLPYIQEHILLEKPFRVFSEKEETLAPPSGNGWSLTTKEEVEETKSKIDPRLKELEKFYDKE